MLYDLKLPVKPELGCYCQKEIPLAEVALMKCWLIQNVASSASGNDWKDEQDPMALMVDLDLSQIQDISFDLAPFALFDPLSQQFDFLELQIIRLYEKDPQNCFDGSTCSLFLLPSKV